MILSELLNKIIDRPAFYLGHESVPLAKAFIDGYAFANSESDMPKEDLLYRGFNQWIADRFHIRTAHDWATIIAFMGLSEAGSFRLLKELWSEYCEQSAMKRTGA